MRHKHTLSSLLLGPILGAVGSTAFNEARGQEPAPPAAPPAAANSYDAATQAATAPAPWNAYADGCVEDCVSSDSLASLAAFRHNRWSLYGGADYLLIRPHFSEAIGFTEVTQTPTSFRTVGQPLDFSYNSSYRVFAGLNLSDAGDALRFTYTSITGDTDTNGTATTPGTSLVDPFGNVAGAVGVIDPQSRLFGQILPGGDAIRTHASVDLNIYDLDYIRPLALTGPEWAVNWSAGLRIADVNQSYSSSVTAAGQQLAYGDFAVDYVGAGPRLGLRGDRFFGNSGFSLFAGGHGSLLVGEYNVQSNNTVALPVTFAAGQSESLTRLIPVLEAEVGAAYYVSDNLRLSAGWLFQSWFDMGTSGGTFGGFFSGADDANIMSFDGLMLRAELGF
jgi:hypothetical protein